MLIFFGLADERAWGWEVFTIADFACEGIQGDRADDNIHLIPAKIELHILIFGYSL